MGAITESNEQNYAKELSGNLATNSWQQKPWTQEHAARKMQIESQKQGINFWCMLPMLFKPILQTEIVR